jgi:DNA-binding NtrC family response regulator
LFAASNATRLLFRQLEQLAPSGATILFLGETGVGKSGCAAAVHKLSGRSGPFEEINCASLRPELAESKLFGHERGAFTGAIERHLGLVEVAEGGTLFLDEFGELPLETQAKLLTFIETRRFRRIGENRVRTANVRIIAATNCDPVEAIRCGVIREDLYRRIATPAVEIPALRARREEIPLLVSRRLGVHANQRRWLTPAVLHALSVRPWTGNVRELFEVVDALKRVPQHAEYVDVGFLQELVRDAIDTDARITVPESIPDDIRKALLVAHALLAEHGEFSRALFTKRMRIPTRTSQRLLNELVERGFLAKRGHGKATKFVAPA